jgi:hypothetical protein
MALRPLPLAVSPSPAPVCPSPATIKGRGAPLGHHHTHLALNRVLSSPQLPSTERLLHRLFPTVAQLCPTLYRPLVLSMRLTSVPSPFPSTIVRFHARGRRSGRSPASLPWDGDCGPPWTGATRGPWARGLGPRISFRKIIPGNSNFGHFALRPLCFFKINPQSNQL